MVLLQSKAHLRLTLYNSHHTSVCSNSKCFYLLYCVWAVCWATKLGLGVPQDQVTTVQRLLVKFFIHHEKNMTKPMILRPGHITDNTKYYKVTNTSVECPRHVLSLSMFMWPRIMSLVTVECLLVIACYLWGCLILEYAVCLILMLNIASLAQFNLLGPLLIPPPTISEPDLCFFNPVLLNLGCLLSLFVITPLILCDEKLRVFWILIVLVCVIGQLCKPQ